MTKTNAPIAALVNTDEVKSITVLKPREFTPKRGIKNVEVFLVEGDFKFKPHHQKTLILELLTKTEDKKMTLKEMVEKVESDEELWKRLNSKQSVFNCITYHIKDLVKIGVLKTKE